MTGREVDTVPADPSGLQLRRRRIPGRLSARSLPTSMLVGNFVESRGEFLPPDWFSANISLDAIETARIAFQHDSGGSGVTAGQVCLTTIDIHRLGVLGDESGLIRKGEQCITIAGDCARPTARKTPPKHRASEAANYAGPRRAMSSGVTPTGGKTDSSAVGTTSPRMPGSS